MKYANKKLDQAHPSSLNMGAYSSARGKSHLALSSIDKRATPTHAYRNGTKTALSMTPALRNGESGTTWQTTKGDQYSLKRD